MANEIIPYLEMCSREGVSLQRGMNYQIGHNHSVILMSVRQGSPYEGRYEDDGTTIIYEGHDVPRSKDISDPKSLDQPEYTPSGNLTENGKFHKAAQEYKSGLREPERIRVYEKIKQGIWSYNGIFHAIDSQVEESNGRNVFKFKLAAVEGDEDFDSPAPRNPKHRRVIPTWVKLEVWKRDGGKCSRCNATNNLHFDHIIPYSKGGSSITPDNIQLLCGKHNIQKKDKIE